VTAAGDLYRPAGSLAQGPWSLVLGPADAGWAFSGLRIADLAPGGDVPLDTGSDEVAIVPLSGSFDVVVGDGNRYHLDGRASVWAGPSDFLYVPPAERLTIASADGGRVAVASARAATGYPARYSPASEVSVELRGAGSCSREVRNFAAADRFSADRLIAVEVLTPSGNWGSYPPHKHDEVRPGETELEELYYYEISGGPGGPGLAYQRVYGTPERPIDVLAEVRSGDLVLVPHGWHGPAMAPPGYDLYYLNVMAGPGERAWLACDDPAHAWVKASWAHQPIDPRLPFGRHATT
jgi:5-deoxy-glucuronate isomerase